MLPHASAQIDRTKQMAGLIAGRLRIASNFTGSAAEASSRVSANAHEHRLSISLNYKSPADLLIRGASLSKRFHNRLTWIIWDFAVQVGGDNKSPLLFTQIHLMLIVHVQENLWRSSLHSVAGR